MGELRIERPCLVYECCDYDQGRAKCFDCGALIVPLPAPSEYFDSYAEWHAAGRPDARTLWEGSAHV